MGRKAEARVVRRLTERLRGGPVHVGALEVFLGDPREGGGPADRAVVADWATFAAQHRSQFRFDPPLLSLEEAADGPARASSPDGAVPPPALPPAEARVVQRLAERLRSGPVHVGALTAFLGDPREGGGPVDRAVVVDWATFAERHRGTFRFEAPLLSLVDPAGGRSHGPFSFSDFLQLTVSQLATQGVATAPFTHAANVESALLEAAANAPTPSSSSPSSISSSTAAAAPDAELPRSQLLLRFVGPEVATSLSRLAAGAPLAPPVKSPPAGTPASSGIAEYLKHLSQPPAEAAAPEDDHDRPGAATVANDAAAMQDVCQHLCDVLVAQAAFPLGLKALARQLERRCPEVRAVLKANGIGTTFKCFADLVRLTLDRHPAELQELGLTMGDDRQWWVARQAAVPGAVSSSAAPPVLGQPAGSDSSAPRDEATTMATATAAGGREAPEVVVCQVVDPDLVRVGAELAGRYSGCLTGSPSPACRHLAVGCLGPGSLLLASPQRAYVLDTARLGVDTVRDALRPFLECPHLHKVIHNAGDAVALWRMRLQLAGVLDTQLAYEHLRGTLSAGLGDVLQMCGVPPLEGPKSDDDLLVQRDSEFCRRERRTTESVLAEVRALASCYNPLVAELGEDLEPILEASHLRGKVSANSGRNGETRLVWFDPERRYATVSVELLQVMGEYEDTFPPQPMAVNGNIQELLRLLPPPFRPLAAPLAPDVTSVVLDLGRRPEAYCGDRRTFLAEDPAVVVTAEHIDQVVAAAGADWGPAGTRAAVPGTLHRLRAIRNPDGAVTGLTLHATRPVAGLAALLSDVLLGQPDCSVLFLGEPQAGKTTALRDVASLLARQHHTVVIDTFGDIGGDGDPPHPALGLARRLRVPTARAQAEVLEECLQNHRPRVLVVDEIGREAEVEALRMGKRRGVRLVAAAAGTLEQLVDDTSLAGLLGGVEPRLAPDGVPARQRVGPPLFNCVVVLRRRAPGEWVVIQDVPRAVDLILQGKAYPACQRSSEPSGLLWYTPLLCGGVDPQSSADF